MDIQKIALAKLMPATYNPRKDLRPNDAEYKKIKKSIETFGYVDPIIVNQDMTIIGGHQRMKVLRDMGYTEVECVVVKLDKDQEKALNIALNKISGEWEMSTLKELLDELAQTDIDIELTGFDMDEIEQLMNDGQVQEVEEDDFDAEKALDEITEPITKQGDVWQLGRHRLMCGDSTNVDDISNLMNKKYPDLIHTDPPYGMNAVSKSGVLSKNYKSDILGDDNTNVAKDTFNLIYSLYPNSKQIWWGANYYSSVLPDSECWLVWDKNNGNSDQTDCELAWANFRSVVRQFTQASEKRKRVHPTQKPVSLMGWIIKRFNLSSKTIADFFGGSGSTLIAAEQLDRICYMMELDPKYCDVIIKRWETLTGKQAQLITKEGESDAKTTSGTGEQSQASHAG